MLSKQKICWFIPFNIATCDSTEQYIVLSNVCVAIIENDKLCLHISPSKTLLYSNTLGMAFVQLSRKDMCCLDNIFDNIPSPSRIYGIVLPVIKVWILYKRRQLLHTGWEWHRTTHQRLKQRHQPLKQVPDPKHTVLADEFIWTCAEGPSTKYPLD